MYLTINLTNLCQKIKIKLQNETKIVNVPHTQKKNYIAN